jgi:Fe-S cluster biosynthesis and repair protein YggX
MSATVTCSRCGEEREALVSPPVPGALGRTLQESVCAACWAEWEAAEVMVINELRLNFMDPDAQATLEQHMREFLFLGDTGATG